MAADQLVIDADAHYFESVRGFAKYLDETWAKRIETWSGLLYTPAGGQALDQDIAVGGRVRRPLLNPEGRTATVATAAGLHMEPETMLRGMRELGVDVAVLLPGALLTHARITDKNVAVALAEGYLETMANEIVDPARGLYGVVIPPCQDPRKGAGLIDQAARHPGICAVAMITDGPRLPLGDAYYDPIYEACCRNQLPLVLHSGLGGASGQESGYNLQSTLENHMAFVLNNEVQLTNFVMQGVQERFPELKVVWQESGIFYVPLIMYRLDMEWSRSRSEAPWLKKPPSEYIKDMYFCTQPLEEVPHLRYYQYVVEMMGGPERLMYASDWPHVDFDHPRTIRRWTFLDDAGRDRILGGNAQQIFRFSGLGCPAADEAGR